MISQDPRSRSRIRSFRHAIHGVFWMIRSQPNARVHLAASVGVVLLGTVLELSRPDWLWILLAMTSVWASEAMNTALEALADAVSPRHDPLVGRAKDVAAGAVLVTSLGAAIIGALVLWPYLSARTR